MEKRKNQDLNICRDRSAEYKQLRFLETLKTQLHNYELFDFFSNSIELTPGERIIKFPSANKKFKLLHMRNIQQTAILLVNM